MAAPATFLANVLVAVGVRHTRPNDGHPTNDRLYVTDLGGARCPIGMADDHTAYWDETYYDLYDHDQLASLVLDLARTTGQELRRGSLAPLDAELATQDAEIAAQEIEIAAVEAKLAALKAEIRRRRRGDRSMTEEQLKQIEQAVLDALDSGEPVFVGIE